MLFVLTTWKFENNLPIEMDSHTFVLIKNVIENENLSKKDKFVYS